MRIRNVLTLAAVIAAAVPPFAAGAQDSRSAASAGRFTTEQLDNLVAPIALYPDAILAQVLVAATFPDQVDFAAKYVRANGTRGIDDQSWDVSVKAVAHYAPVLNMLADRPDWTTALGQAYAAQSSDVMESVQHLREMAREQGNLQSTSQQTVIVEDQNIRIVPARPQVIYVPTYDPEIIYYRPVFGLSMYAGYWSFGIGFPIGAWLSYDCDWYGRRVYYDGWRGGGWRVAAYPFISINTVYVHPRYQDVYINREIWRRPVDYGRFGRFNTVHRDVTWNDRGRGDRPGPVGRGVPNNGGIGPRREVNPPRGNVNPPRGDDSRSQGWNDGGNRGRNDNRGQGRNDNRGTAGVSNGANDARGYRNGPVNGPPPAVERKAVQRSRDNPPAESRINSVPPTRSAAPREMRYSAPPQTRNVAPPQARSAPPPSSKGSAPPPKGSSKGTSRGGDRRR